MKRGWIILLLLAAGCIGQTPGPSESSTPSSTPQPSSGPRVYKDLTDAQILELMDQFSPVVLYLYSPTCSTCETVKPLVEELYETYHLDIIWVSRQENLAIFDTFHFSYYPAIYVHMGSEVYVHFQESDSLTRIYQQITDETIVGMHKVEYLIQDTDILIPTSAFLPETLYYLDYENRRLFIFISKTATLFVFSGSQNCETNWLYLKDDLLYDGENAGRWQRDTLLPHGGTCGGLVSVHHTVTGSSIVVSIEDLKVYP
ncbi:MAG: thioredoxin family protein [Theionarchaea archaeon]|nr:thioredoxin family protein [Theionarchaea archaeon]MBU7036573.1 thioredoxin family protein [Theionarchaea archaeon]